MLEGMAVKAVPIQKLVVRSSVDQGIGSAPCVCHELCVADVYLLASTSIFAGKIASCIVRRPKREFWPLPADRNAILVNLRSVQNYEGWMSWSTNPLYAVLHESIYCQGQKSAWAAQTVRDSFYPSAFNAVQRAELGLPVQFTGKLLVDPSDSPG